MNQDRDKSERILLQVALLYQDQRLWSRASQPRRSNPRSARSSSSSASLALLLRNEPFSKSKPNSPISNPNERKQTNKQKNPKGVPWMAAIAKSRWTTAMRSEREMEDLKGGRKSRRNGLRTLNGKAGSGEAPGSAVV